MMDWQRVMFELFVVAVAVLSAVTGSIIGMGHVMRERERELRHEIDQLRGEVKTLRGLVYKQVGIANPNE